MNTLTLVGNISVAETDGRKYLSVGITCPQRPDLETRYSIGLKLTHRALAERLVRAINAGVAFDDVRVTKDVHGVEYVTCRGLLYTRFLNAELTRKGF